MPHISVLLSIFVTITYASKWETETETLNVANYIQAIGFYNDTIFIIGGHNHPYKLVQYSTRGNVIINDTVSDESIRTAILCGGQAWVQNNSWLYLIPWIGTHFVVYGLETKVMTEWNDTQQIFPQSVGDSACLALHHNFLFVVGGYASGIGYLDTTQIFDMTRNEWLSSTPRLNEKRGLMPCLVHPNTDILYTFGGYDGSVLLSSMELLSVSDMDNIGQYNWEIHENFLLSGRCCSRAVIYGNDILIIGGNIGSNQYIPEVRIFHTLDNTLDFGESMNVALGYTAAIMTPNYTLYTFGGRTHNNIDLDTIQSLQLTPPPTTNPTQNPSEITLYPSKNPTNIPTHSTANPTNNPPKPTQLSSSTASTNDLNFKSTLIIVTCVSVGCCLCVLIIAVIICCLSYARRKNATTEGQSTDKQSQNDVEMVVADPPGLSAADSMNIEPGLNDNYEEIKVPKLEVIDTSNIEGQQKNGDEEMYLKANDIIMSDGMCEGMDTTTGAEKVMHNHTNYEETNGNV